MIRIGLTGTDTGVGKTVIGIAALVAWRDQGLSVAAMKPAETGTIAGAADAARLAAAAGARDPIADVCPFVFAEPLAPLMAARRAGTRVDLDALDAAFARLSAHRDAVLVEGAGGLLVPLTEQASYADLFARWQLELIVVAANRLGAINHVLLTIRAARGAGLRVRGVVLNTLHAGPPDIAQRTNPALLSELLPQVPVILWPWIQNPYDHAAVAQIVERPELLALLGESPADDPSSHRT